MHIHRVSGGRGLELHVREWGNPDGKPILFIHGWSQSHMSWSGQYDSALAETFRIAAMDMRGHGSSDAPLDASQYTDGDAWADDVAAVIAHLGLAGVTLVGWSYAGFVISDYVRKYGQDDIAGINLVGGAVVLDETAFGTLIGVDFLRTAPPASSDDAPTSIAAIRAFLRACFVAPLTQDDFETALAYNMLTPSAVRGFLTQRQLDFSPVLEKIKVPMLVTQGRGDTIVLPGMAEHILAHCPTAKASWYEEIGHAPFIEAADRFNRELGDFVEACSA